DPGLCPKCGKKMIPNPSAEISAHVTCNNCNSSFGLINSNTCPNCGKPFQ
ncbi:MAG: YfgJ family double zinc ribbon protein, partial [Planctomycetota bacterium]